MATKTKSLKIIVLAVSALVAGCLKQKPTAKDVLNGLLNKYKSHKSISFHSNITVKPIRADVSKFSVSVKLIKNDKDTIFNGYVWVSSKWGNYDYTRYYNLDKIYLIDDSLKTVKVYNDPKTQYWAIDGNTRGYKGRSVCFLDASDIEFGVKDSSAHVMLTNEKINNEDCYKVFIKLKDGDGFKDRYRIVWIRASDTTLVQMKTYGTMQGAETFSEWSFDNVEYDRATPETLQAEFSKLSSYQTSQYTPPDPEKEKPLANGLKAPVFEGTIYATGKHTSLADLKGKPVLIDFWYITCPWCVKAMPVIEKMENEFKAKGLVVLGINSFDVKDKDKSRLDEIIKSSNMNYDILLSTRRTDSLYNVHGYPTVYLIDRKGNIVASHVGYAHNLDSTLEAAITQVIKK